MQMQSLPSLGIPAPDPDPEVAASAAAAAVQWPESYLRNGEGGGQVAEVVHQRVGAGGGEGLTLQGRPESHTPEFKEHALGSNY